MLTGRDGSWNIVNTGMMSRHHIKMEDTKDPDRMTMRIPCELARHRVFCTQPVCYFQGKKAVVGGV
jgi:hypothetical protein